MPTRYQEALIVQLRSRYRRLYKSDYGQFGHELRYTIDWMRTQPSLAQILMRMESGPALDIDSWLTESTDYGRETMWPETEEERAKVVWHLLLKIRNEGGAVHFLFGLTSETNGNDAVRSFTEGAVESFVEYLEDRLSAENDLLYVLDRYRRRMLWFEKERLWKAYKDDTSHGEETYTEDLQHFLFDQGVDYPFSQPHGPSGRPDLLSGVGTDEPFACEVKLFDAETYGITYLAKVLNQARRYAEDYSETCAYLVIYNLTDRQLVLPTDQIDDSWPPRLVVDGVTIYLVVVQAAPLPSASSQGKARQVNVKREQLVDAGA